MPEPILIKVCSICKSGKHVSEFFRQKGKKDGYRSACKSCFKLTARTKEEQDAYLRKYWKTPRGRGTTLWHAMNQRVNSDDPRNACYKDVEVRMTKMEFLAWIEPLLEAWFRERPDETPSVDHIESNRHYEIGNVQLISLSENTAKVPNINDAAPGGTRWCPDCKQFLPIKMFFSKPVYCKPCHKTRVNTRHAANPLRRLQQSAHQAVYKAVKKGILAKPDKCQHDGCEKTRIDAHHHKGYERQFWLDVQWLCRKHHAEEERSKPQH